MDSFYVADVGRVLELYDFWKSTFPSIQPFYAVKSNSDPVLLSALASLGTGFDCASKVISYTQQLRIHLGDFVIRHGEGKLHVGDILV